jgi:hypothetical protein
MIKYFTWLILAMLMVYQADSIQAGEFYQYADDEGNLIFTDDLTKVPKEKQSGVKTFQSVVSKPQSSNSEPAETADPIQSDISSGTPEVFLAPEDETANEDQIDLKSEEESDTAEQYSEEAETTADQTTEEATTEEQIEYFVGSDQSDIPETNLEKPESSDHKVRTGRFERKIKGPAEPRAVGKGRN